MFDRKVFMWNFLKSVGNILLMNSKSQTTLAIPFISYEDGQFRLSKQAEEFLGTIPEERQLGIVSIVGKYRTGKSFFVNRVLLDQKKGGFQVGPTVNPCTKGLWLWKKTIPSTSNPNMDLLVVDTEGFGGMDENTNHDSRIFLFSLLLSSYFIYNSQGSIDENALTSLQLITKFANKIQSEVNGKVQDVSSFPAFLWVVRDFTLMLQDKNGNKINSKEYLENALELQKGNSDAIEKKNKVRRQLKHFFLERDCEMMVRPIQREKDLQRMDELDNSMLRPEFVNQVSAIRTKILATVKSKKINGNALNGSYLVSMCRGYMDIINKGGTPTVQSAWFYVCRSEGLKAVKEATEYLEQEVEELLKNPVKNKDIGSLKQKLREQVIRKFKKRSLGSQESHPDLLQKLEKRLQQNMGSLIRKNKVLWQDRYKQASERYTDSIKQKIYNDEYEQFSDFIRDFEIVKDQYDEQTSQGDSIEKWKYFNEISQNLYRLAGETITTKINRNLHQEKLMIQQKMQIQEQELQERQKEMITEKQNLKQKIMALQKQNAKVVALQDSHKSRALQYKTQHDKLYQKYRTLYNDHEETVIQLQKLKKETKKQAENDIEEARNELASIRSTLEKERALHEMEKKYMEEEVERYKGRTASLENQCRKLRTNNTKLTSDFEELQNKYEEKKEEAEILVQTNSSFSKKIETLIAENSMKNEMMSDHSEWMLEKSYLENQVSFLKSTLSENKKLHDALLVALQQSVSASESQSQNELAQTNKNLTMALQKVEARCKVLQEKYDRVKEFKKVMKSCLSMQCANCSKWVQAHAFSTHVEQCLGGCSSLMKQKMQNEWNRQNLHIAVSQTVIKDSEDKKKPYTEYKVQLTLGDSKWKVSKRYKQFSELQQVTSFLFPDVDKPFSFYKVPTKLQFLN